VHLLVAVQGLLADAAGGPPRDGEAVREVGDRPLEALADRREVLLVAGDQGRVGLAGEALGKIERAAGPVVHATPVSAGQRA
jgi:hypothetical protein